MVMIALEKISMAERQPKQRKVFHHQSANTVNERSVSVHIPGETTATDSFGTPAKLVNGKRNQTKLCYAKIKRGLCFVLSYPKMSLELLCK